MVLFILFLGLVISGWRSAYFNEKQRADSVLVAAVEKINGLDRKYFAGRKVLIPDNLEEAKNYRPEGLSDRGYGDFDSIIVVDLARSWLAVYRQGRLLFWAPITRGRKARFTPTGLFAIQAKWRLIYSKKYGNVPMPWAMHITGNICIHQGPMMGRGASHGCLRLFRRDAHRLYEWARVGAPVLIK